MTSQSVKTLGLFQKPGIFDKGIEALLPEAYKKFYKEWRFTEPAAVHYIPEEGKYKRNELTGEVTPVQNNSIPLMFPKEAENQIWGGEGIIQGFKKKISKKRNHHPWSVPHFWVPVLKRSVVYSEVLDKYISVIITDRAIDLINANYGFDHYLLKSPACDIRNLLPLGIKRKILLELEKGCPTYRDRPEKQKEILKSYGQYLEAYTSEEIKWYGYSLPEAIKKLKCQMEIEEKEKIVPLKHIYRAQLINKLKFEAAAEAAGSATVETGPSDWIQKLNPFSKKHET